MRRNESLCTVSSSYGVIIPEPYDKKEWNKKQEFDTETFEWIIEFETSKRISEIICKFWGENGENSLYIRVLFNERHIRFFLLEDFTKFLRLFLKILFDSSGTSRTDRIHFWLVGYLFEKYRIVTSIEFTDSGLN